MLLIINAATAEAELCLICVFLKRFQRTSNKAIKAEPKVV